MVAILNSFVSDIYYGMLRGQIHNNWRGVWKKAPSDSWSHAKFSSSVQGSEMQFAMRILRSIRCHLGSFFMHPFNLPLEHPIITIWNNRIQNGCHISKKVHMWLHSSVGRASHWYCGSHSFESRWSPDFLHASSSQLLKSENLLPWSLFF